MESSATTAGLCLQQSLRQGHVRLEGGAGRGGASGNIRGRFVSAADNLQEVVYPVQAIIIVLWREEKTS